MLKQIAEFFVTGITLVVLYLLYFISTVILTIVLGLPVLLGIKMITDILQTFFIGRI